MSKTKIKKLKQEKFDEYYRPKTLDEIAAPPGKIEKIRSKLDKGTGCPHFFFYGPPGTGKSTTAFAILKYMNCNKRGKFLRTNASTSFTMDYIRNTLIPFTNTAGPKSGIKIVILDEVDESPRKSLPAIRDLMEKNQYVKFILICNWYSKIVKPIKSRCYEVEFGYLEPKDMLPRLRYVADDAGIQASDKLLLRIAKVSGGDMRSALIDYLQDFIDYDGKIPDDIEIKSKSDKIRKYCILLTKKSLNGKLVECIHTFKSAQKYFRLKDMIGDFVDTITYNKKYPNDMKADMLIVIAEVDKMINLGSKDEVAFVYLASKFDKIGIKYS